MLLQQQVQQRGAIPARSAQVRRRVHPSVDLRERDEFARVAPHGGRLLLADFWTDHTHTKPLQAALMAGEFAVHLRDGDVYSIDEIRTWLIETGWRYLDHVPLAGPQSLIVAEAT